MHLRSFGMRYCLLHVSALWDHHEGQPAGIRTQIFKP